MDRPCILFAVAATLAAACLFGLLPAMQASRDVNRALATGTRVDVRPRTRPRASALVAVEIALAVALLVGAGAARPQLPRARAHAARHRVARRADDFAVAAVGGVQGPGPARRLRRAVLARVAGRRDVEAAGAIFGLPLTDFSYYISGDQRDAEALSQEEQNRLSVNVRVVTPVYFRALGIPIVAGRDFGSAIAAAPRRSRSSTRVPRGCSCRAGPPTWPSRCRRDASRSGRRSRGRRDRGGRRRCPRRRAGAAARPTLYLAHAQFPMGFLTLVVRAPHEPDDLVHWLRPTVAGGRSGSAGVSRPDDEQFASRVPSRSRGCTWYCSPCSPCRGRPGGDWDLRGDGAERRRAVARNRHARRARRDQTGSGGDDRPLRREADRDRRRHRHRAGALWRGRRSAACSCSSPETASPTWPWASPRSALALGCGVAARPPRRESRSGRIAPRGIMGAWQPTSRTRSIGSTSCRPASSPLPATRSQAVPERARRDQEAAKTEHRRLGHQSALLAAAAGLQAGDGGRSAAGDAWKRLAGEKADVPPRRPRTGRRSTPRSAQRGASCNRPAIR